MGLWSRFKGVFRSAPPAREWPPINEDWAVGDLAECIVPGKWACDEPGPDVGDVHRVLAVIKGTAFGTNEPGWGLKLSGYQGYFAATCFRKVLPRADAAERCDAAFLEQVRQGCVPADGAR